MHVVPPRKLTPANVPIELVLEAEVPPDMALPNSRIGVIVTGV
jgi:hypothetical protein